MPIEASKIESLYPEFKRLITNAVLETASNEIDVIAENTIDFFRHPQATFTLRSLETYLRQAIQEIFKLSKTYLKSLWENDATWESEGHKEFVEHIVAQNYLLNNIREILKEIYPSVAENFDNIIQEEYNVPLIQTFDVGEYHFVQEAYNQFIEEIDAPSTYDEEMEDGTGHLGAGDAPAAADTTLHYAGGGAPAPMEDMPYGGAAAMPAIIRPIAIPTAASVPTWSWRPCCTSCWRCWS